MTLDYSDLDFHNDPENDDDGSWFDETLDGSVDLGIYDGGTPSFMATTSDPEILESDYWRSDYDDGL